MDIIVMTMKVTFGTFLLGETDRGSDFHLITDKV
jgi:hypothetical protein